MGRQKSLDHSLFWKLTAVRSTEVQKTKALPSRAIFGGSPGGLGGMAAREKRLEEDLKGRDVPSADDGCPQYQCLTLLSSPTAPALVFGVQC